MASRAASSIVRSAQRASRACTGGESVLVAISAGTLTLAAAIAGGAASWDGQAMAAGGLAAILAAVSWQVERRGGAEDIARAIDRHFGLGGAVLTAHQAESTRPDSPVTRLLSRDVARTVSWQAFARGQARRVPFFLALPFACIALWGLALEGPRGSTGGSENPASTHASTRVLASRIRAQAARFATQGGLPDPVAEKVRDLAARAEALELQAPATRPPSKDLLDDVDALEREWDLLRRSIGPEEVTLARREGTMDGPDRRDDLPPATSMQGSRTEVPTAAPPAEGPARRDVVRPGVEGAVLGSRWWPARHDGIVDRWIEAERSSRDRRSR